MKDDRFHYAHGTIDLKAQVCLTRGVIGYIYIMISTQATLIIFSVLSVPHFGEISSPIEVPTSPDTFFLNIQSTCQPCA
jgi:hypothetical protein